MGILGTTFAWLNETLASMFWFAVVIGVLVFLHEAGHFLTGKFFGIRIEVFSLGFGHRLFGRKRGDTDYRISIIPLGGYVGFAGGNEAATTPTGELPADYFLARPRWQRFLVLVAGVVVNLALAVTLFAAAFMVGMDLPKPIQPVLHRVEAGKAAAAASLQAGDRIVRVGTREVSAWDEVERELVKSGPREVEVEVERAGVRVVTHLLPALAEDGMPEIGAEVRVPAVATQIDPAMPAAHAGIQDGDQILVIDGVEIADSREAIAIIHAAIGRELAITVDRGGEHLALHMTPVAWSFPDGKTIGRIGLVFAVPMELVQLAPVAALERGVAMAVDEAGLVFSVLRHLLAGDLPFRTLSGPIEIARVSKVAARGSRLLAWMAFISLQLGIMNLLPIPMLDGGQIFILLTEGILRRDLSAALKGRLQFLGFVALVTLMVAVVVTDVMKSLGAI